MQELYLINQHKKEKTVIPNQDNGFFFFVFRRLSLNELFWRIERSIDNRYYNILVMIEIHRPATTDKPQYLVRCQTTVISPPNDEITCVAVLRIADVNHRGCDELDTAPQRTTDIQITIYPVGGLVGSGFIELIVALAANEGVAFFQHRLADTVELTFYYVLSSELIFGELNGMLLKTSTTVLRISPGCMLRQMRIGSCFTA